jgi:hypothetical protein
VATIQILQNWKGWIADHTAPDGSHFNAAELFDLTASAEPTADLI